MISLPKAIMESAEERREGAYGEAISPPRSRHRHRPRPHLTYANKPKGCGRRRSSLHPRAGPQPPPIPELGPDPGGEEEKGGLGKMHVEPGGGK